ncbi:MAG TPA: hypothetical protein VK447_12140, partial [Myxococcaceae bacterium]|nr:hypothetical protein [Myxococcaceae bacterium]
MRIRQLEPADLPAVLALQREAYRPELHEPESSFANKRALFPQGALGCFDGERLRGYAFVLPWRGEGVVPLCDALDALPRDP